MARDDIIHGAYAGLLAVSSAAVSKYAKRREPILTSIPSGFVPPSLQDAPRLLSSKFDSNEEHRMARVTAASILHSLETTHGSDPYRMKRGGLTEKLLTREDKRTFDSCGERCAHRPPQLCRYCTLFHDLAHAGTEPEIEVVNHGARIVADFDPETNISYAGIDNYQLFVPERLALLALERSHPFSWKAEAPDLFERIAAAKSSGEKPHRKWHEDETVSRETWSSRAARQTEYLYEAARMPWNEQISSRVENVLRIDDFADTFRSAEELGTFLDGFKFDAARDKVRLTEGVKAFSRGIRSAASPRPFKGSSCAGARILSYRYALQSCQRSSYGLAWEEYSGLNVDDGGFHGSAIHFENIKPVHTAHLTQTDVVHLAHALDRRASQAQGQAVLEARTAHEELLRMAHEIDGAEGPKHRAEVHAAVRRAAEGLRSLWNEEPWLLTIAASKRLRYTVPMNGPVELWATLTWMAPALLFSFMNRAVCQLPHFLIRKGGYGTLPRETYPPHEHALGTDPDGVFESQAAAS